MVGRSTRDIERALLRKGFYYSDSHHRYLTLYSSDQSQSIKTFLSHGVDEYGDELLAKVARQLYLSKAELLRLIDCEMDGDEYLRLMVERGHVKP